MNMSKNNDLIAQLKKASEEKDKALRGVRIASVITAALNPVGIDPVLVGGSAVAYFTDGVYTTNDIDMIAPTTNELKQVMKELGFGKIGKDFVNKRLGIYVEFPSDALGPTEKYSKLNLEGSTINIISIEDLIVDRLAAFKYWKSGIDGVNALMMLEQDLADRGRLEDRAREEDVLDALDHVEFVLKEATRNNMAQDKASNLLMSFWKSR